MSDGLIMNTKKYLRLVDAAPVAKESGKVTRIVGNMIEGYLPGASIGSLCRIFINNGNDYISVEVVGINEQRVIMMPYTHVTGIRMGSPILLYRSRATVKVGKRLLGRVINATGDPLDNKGKILLNEERNLYSDVVNPLNRDPITKPLDLGVKAINSFITVGEGQRISVLAGSGVGKSVLLGMMSRKSEADVNVIALIGERGREVREFIEDVLGEEGMRKTVIIAATSDENALLRARGAFLAATIAEYFAEQGNKVLLTMDSVTRYAMAQREMGLAAGEPPATKGYTPSVFAQLPKILERAGNFQGSGSITGIYTVLVEGDDIDDPIGDSVRSIADGHIVLSRKLAQKAHFPAIDVLASASRVMQKVQDPETLEASMKVRELMAIYAEAEDMIQIGAYQEGTNPKIDKAIEFHDEIQSFLKQKVDEEVHMDDCRNFLVQLTARF